MGWRSLTLDLWAQAEMAAGLIKSIKEGRAAPRGLSLSSYLLSGKS